MTLRLARGLNIVSVPHRGQSGGTPSPSGMAIGLNLDDSAYYKNNPIFTDYRFGGQTASMPSGLTVPAANMNSSHQVISLPGTDTKVRYVMQPPETATSLNITFTGGNVVSSLTGFQCTINSFDYNAGTANVTPTFAQPTSSGWGLDFTPSGATIPQILSAIPSGMTGGLTVEPNADTHIKALTTSNGPLREMKPAGVEQNEGVTVSSTATAFPAAVLTASNRNTLVSQDWAPNDGTTGGMPNDGRPMEASIQIAVQEGRPLWRSLPWNASNDYYDAIGDLAAQAAIDHQLVTWFEQSNEVWNFTYKVATQAFWEGIAGAITDLNGVAPTVFVGSISGNVLTVSSITSGPSIAVGKNIGGTGLPGNVTVSSFGTGTGGTGTYNLSASFTISSQTMVAGGGRQTERYIDKSNATMARIKARYAAAEVANSLPTGSLDQYFQPVLSWQNAVPTNLTAMIARSGTNHKVLASAPYVTQQSIAQSSTVVSDFFNAMYSDMDTVIDVNMLAFYNAAKTAGMKYACYEYGQSCYISDATTRAAVQNTSSMYDLYMHLYARTEAKAPDAIVCDFILGEPDQPTSSPTQSWGILPYSNKTIDSTTPKYSAKVDFLAGKRKLLALTGTFASATTSAGSATNGQVLGTVLRRTPGSSIAITSTPAGAFSFVDPTAQTLQVQVADSTQFASAGSISWSVVETDARDTAGSRTTTGSFVVTAPGTMNLNFATGTYSVNGTSYALASIPGWSYTRANSLTVIDQTGAVATYTANTIPLANGVLHSYVGLSNLLANGQAFDSAGWNKTNITVTANTTVAPDGTTTADTASISAQPANNMFESPSGQASGSPFTFSWFALRGTATDLEYSLRDTIHSVDIVPSTSYYSQTNGSTFSRIIAPYTAGSTGTACYVIRGATSTGTAILWQAQVLAGTFADGGPIVTSATSTPTQQFTFPNGTYSVTYTFDDNSTQVVSQTVSTGVFPILTAPTLNRGRIKSIVC